MLEVSLQDVCVQTFVRSWWVGRVTDSYRKSQYGVARTMPLISKAGTLWPRVVLEGEDPGVGVDVARRDMVNGAKETFRRATQHACKALTKDYISAREQMHALMRRSRRKLHPCKNVAARSTCHAEMSKSFSWRLQARAIRHRSHNHALQRVGQEPLAPSDPHRGALLCKGCDDAVVALGRLLGGEAPRHPMFHSEVLGRSISQGTAYKCHWTLRRHLKVALEPIRASPVR